MNETSVSDRHYFAGYFDWDLVKCSSVIWQSAIVVTSPVLLYLVVWYERNSADLRYRTIINQLLSKLCLIEIVAVMTAQPFSLAILIGGPVEARHTFIIKIMFSFYPFYL